MALGLNRNPNQSNYLPGAQKKHDSQNRLSAPAEQSWNAVPCGGEGDLDKGNTSQHFSQDVLLLHVQATGFCGFLQHLSRSGREESKQRRVRPL